MSRGEEEESEFRKVELNKESSEYNSIFSANFQLISTLNQLFILTRFVIRVKRDIPYIPTRPLDMAVNAS